MQLQGGREGSVKHPVVQSVYTLLVAITLVLEAICVLVSTAQAVRLMAGGFNPMGSDAVTFLIREFELPYIVVRLCFFTGLLSFMASLALRAWVAFVDHHELYAQLMATVFGTGVLNVLSSPHEGPTASNPLTCTASPLTTLLPARPIHWLSHPTDGRLLQLNHPAPQWYPRHVRPFRLPLLSAVRPRRCALIRARRRVCSHVHQDCARPDGGAWQADGPPLCVGRFPTPRGKEGNVEQAMGAGGGHEKAAETPTT